MSNRTYLLNTRIPTSDCGLLDAASEREGIEYVEVGEGGHVLIPIPWLCCFRQSDLRPAQHPGGSGYDDPDWRHLVWLPCAAVETARENLRNSLGLMEKIVGDATVARAYWALAMEALEGLRLPYLTIDLSEFFDLNDVEDWGPVVAAALSGDDEAIPHIVALTGYYEGIPPLTMEELYSGVDITGVPDYQERVHNASVLDMLLQ